MPSKVWANENAATTKSPLGGLASYPARCLHGDCIAIDTWPRIWPDRSRVPCRGKWYYAFPGQRDKGTLTCQALARPWTSMRYLPEWVHPCLSYFGCVFSHGCGSVRGCADGQRPRHGRALDRRAGRPNAVAAARGGRVLLRAAQPGHVRAGRRAPFLTTGWLNGEGPRGHLGRAATVNPVAVESARPLNQRDSGCG